MRNKQSLWSNLCKAGLAIVAVSAFVSCGNKEFTSGRAEDAIEDLPFFQDSANVVTLKAGYFEENDASTRLKLRQLAANEMLTYSAEQINEYIPAGYWTSAKTIPHVFVTVALTEKGKKFVVTEPIKDKDAEELKNKNKEEKYPEAGVVEAEQITLRNPQAGSPAPENNENTESNYEDSGSSDSSYSSSEDASPYKLAKEKEKTDIYNMLSCKLKVYKVKNLVCNEESMKESKASCDAITEIKDATPFGRILSGVKNGDRQMNKNIQFIYYVDKGWQVQMPDTESK